MAPIGKAVLRSAAYTCVGVAAVFDCSISAAIPAACGVAAEVPKKFGYFATF